MGGSETALIGTAIGLASRVMTGSSSESSQLAAERAAQAEELRQKEAAARKQERDQLLDARKAESKRQAEEKTTLSNGGAGLLDEPETASTQLKKTLGG